MDRRARPNQILSRFYVPPIAPLCRMERGGDCVSGKTSGLADKLHTATKVHGGVISFTRYRFYVPLITPP